MKDNKVKSNRHPGGAPEKYSEDWLKEEAQHLIEWTKREDSIFFKTFAVERGYHPNRLQEFADKSLEFSGAFELAKAWQEQRLVVSGLFNKTNASLTKFCLTNCHGWSEKQEAALQYNPLDDLPSSKNLVLDKF